MRPLICFIFSVLFWTTSSGQNDSNYSDMLLEARHFIFSQPQEAIEIAEHVSLKTSNNIQFIEAYLIVYTSNFVIGDYNQAVNSFFKSSVRATDIKDLDMQLKTSFYSIPVLYKLGLNTVAKESISNRSKLSKKQNKNANHWLKASHALINFYDAYNNEVYEKAISNLSKVEEELKLLGDTHFINFILQDSYQLYLKTHTLAEAKEYLNNLLVSNSDNKWKELILNDQLGTLYFNSKNHEKSLGYDLQALSIANNFNNNPFRAQLNENISTNYLALEDNKQFHNYLEASNQFYNESEINEDEAINSIYNYINKNHIVKLNNVETNYHTQMLILLGLLSIAIISFVSLKFRYNSRQKQYQEFINYFEKRENTPVIQEKPIAKTLNIPKETENIILERLSHFENSKQFTKKDMSLAQLASSFDTNTKYLSEVINSHKDKNFNAYINDLRINYIIDKLESDKTYLQYKISYLAEESGFSTHSSFGAVFKSVTGISPKVFIEILASQNKKPKASTLVYD